MLLLLVPLFTLPHLAFSFYTTLGFDLKGQYYHAKQNEEWKDNAGYLREAFVSQIMDKVISEIQKQDMILKEYSDASVCNDNIEFSLITMVFIISLTFSFYLKRKFQGLKRRQIKQRVACDKENLRAIRNSNFSVARPEPHFNDSHHFEREQ